MECILLKCFPKHIKQSKMNKSSQTGFSKQGLCLINPTTFYDDVTGKMNEVRLVVPVYLGLSKAFHSSIHDILIDKLISMQSIKTVRWIRKVAEQLGSRGWDQGHSWMQVFNSMCQGMILGQILLNSLGIDG